ncbi:MAG: hypothetical protein PHE70_08395 [Tepidanaerobacteraceae bacterium]|nr:hypothetical protein [Tepidanaerobacteraceae bacterium]
MASSTAAVIDEMLGIRAGSPTSLASKGRFRFHTRQQSGIFPACP